MEQGFIRNFCIIAHVDHGKSTLADRFLELTGTVPPREMRAQFLDQMDLERERGVTIKAQAVRMLYRRASGEEYQLNLIDTPGHVDFSYEVSRSLAACQGAILVVDATQGIQAQTLAHASLALKSGLRIIPVLNKIDLPNAQIERVMKELEEVFGFSSQEILLASAKEGTGVREVLEAVAARIPPPAGNPQAPLRALIFDSKYDPYKGVIAYISVVDGFVEPGRKLRLMANNRPFEALEAGSFRPQLTPERGLAAGEVGYIATGLKQVRECRAGDSITRDDEPASQPLPGYRPPKPMVYASLYPTEGEEYPLLRDALDKLRLNDASLSYEPEFSAALGFGFRCGFLGVFHMEIVQERLEREYSLRILATAPGVAFQALTTKGQEVEIDRPSALPSPAEVRELREPWVEATIVTPSRFIGAVMEVFQARRGEYQKLEYLGGGGAPGESPALDPRALLVYQLPLSELILNFYEDLQAATQGYASLDYFFSQYRPAPLVKLEILVNNQPVDALSSIAHKDKAFALGKALVEKLRELIPRQLFDVPIQAAVGSRVISRETVKALRKNVLAKCYGGDVTRKRKLLEKQAEGKKRLKKLGRVEIPQEAFLALLKLGKSRD